MFRMSFLFFAILSFCHGMAENAQAQKNPSKRGIVSNTNQDRKPDTTAQAELENGNAAFDRKEWPKAIERYTIALKLQPDLLPALINRGRAQFFLGRLDSALVDLKKACEVAPESPYPHMWFAAVSLDKGDILAAINSSSKTIQLDAKLALAWYVRGTARIHQGNCEKAIEDLNEAAKLSPNEPDIFNNRAIAWQKLGEEKKAQVDFERRDQLKRLNEERISAAKLLARERLQQAEQEYRLIDQLVAAHEARIRTQQSIRVPPGVRRPQIDPIPNDLLQRRAMAWNALQQARKTFNETP